MADLDLLQFHAQSLREYAALWFDQDACQEEELSEEEAAYHLCEHAAMLLRYTGQEVYLQGLAEQAPDWRRSLVLAVCRYLTGLGLIATARRLLSVDVLDSDELTELEDLIIERDAIEEVLALATRLSADLFHEGELRRELATSRAIVAELDVILWTRPDALSVACRVLAGLRAQLAIEPDKRGQWWFGKAVDLDENFERKSLVELLDDTAVTKRSPRPKDVVDLSSSLFVQRPSTVQVALAAADVPSVLPAPSLATLIPELPGMRAVVTRLDANTYQFVFVDDRTREHSAYLDGHRLVIRRGNEDRATSSITAGVATLRGCGDFDSCRIETTDGQLVGTLVLDASNG